MEGWLVDHGDPINSKRDNWSKVRFVKYDRSILTDYSKFVIKLMYNSNKNNSG